MPLLDEAVSCVVEGGVTEAFTVGRGEEVGAVSHVDEVAIVAETILDMTAEAGEVGTLGASLDIPDAHNGEASPREVPRLQCLWLPVEKFDDPPRL